MPLPTRLLGLLGVGGAAGLATVLSRPISRLVAGTRSIGEGNFGVTLPVTSRDELGDLTRSFNDMARALREKEMIKRAFMVATTGRPGPVVVIVPEDICHGTLPYDEAEFAIDPRYEAAPALRCRPASDDLAKAAKLLAASGTSPWPNCA